MEPIQISGLVKHFGRTTALDGLDLTVSAGEVHGFLGPNGAGKSTTLRILLGLLRADAGTVRLLGADPWADVAVRRRVAYVPGDVALWPSLTGGEVIDLIGALRGGLDAARRAELVEIFDLDVTKKCRAYSKGNRQKVALVAALASGAEVLLLDEPTSGLDPLMEAAFAAQARALVAQGATILLSSHILSEVEKLADRLSIVRAGRIVETGTLTDLRHLRTTTVTAELASAPTELATLPGVSGLVVAPAASGATDVTFTVEPGALDSAVAVLSRHGIRTLVSEPPSLEDLFLSWYGADSPADRARP